MPLTTPVGHVATCHTAPLQFRKIWKKLFLLEISTSDDGQKLWRSVFGSLLAVGGIFILFGFTAPPSRLAAFLNYFAVYILILFGLLFFIVLYEWLYIWTYYYDVGDDFLRIRKGVVIRKEISVPFARIQDVYIDQDVVDHLLQLYDVHISTATQSSGLEAHIDGVNHTNAEKIHSLILDRIKTANDAKPQSAPV